MTLAQTEHNSCSMPKEHRQRAPRGTVQSTAQSTYPPLCTRLCTRPPRPRAEPARHLYTPPLHAPCVRLLRTRRLHTDGKTRKPSHPANFSARKTACAHGLYSPPVRTACTGGCCTPFLHAASARRFREPLSRAAFERCLSTRSLRGKLPSPEGGRERWRTHGRKRWRAHGRRCWRTYGRKRWRTHGHRKRCRLTMFSQLLGNLAAERRSQALAHPRSQALAHPRSRALAHPRSQALAHPRSERPGDHNFPTVLSRRKRALSYGHSRWTGRMGDAAHQTRGELRRR